MPLFSYPANLPAPQDGWQGTGRERAVRSSLAGDPQARRRSRDAIVDVSSATWTYTPAQMDIWWSWYHDTLIDGQLWFQAVTPGAGGWVARVMKFRPASLQIQPLGRGHSRVQIDIQIRGRSAAPQVA